MIKAIDRLFHRLSATYGADWDRSLGQTPISDAKTVWAHELSPFKNSLNRLAWALENLPERCPNVIVFKKLCQSAPVPDAPALPEPKADPKRVAEELAKLAPLRQRTDEHKRIDHKAWAKRLQARHIAGEKLNMNQVRCMNIALGVSV